MQRAKLLITELDQGLKGKPPRPVLYRAQSLGLDAVLPGAGILAVLGLSLGLASQLSKDQGTALLAERVGGCRRTRRWLHRWS